MHLLYCLSEVWKYLFLQVRKGMRFWFKEELLMTWQGIWLNNMEFQRDILKFLIKPRNELKHKSGCLFVAPLRVFYSNIWDFGTVWIFREKTENNPSSKQGFQYQKGFRCYEQRCWREENNEREDKLYWNDC